jgi:hypothetical protein
MSVESRRIAREQKTIITMLRMFCHDQHGIFEGLCDDCERLREYVLKRLELCPFRLNKPTCLKCSVHCYKEDMREQMRKVMRYAGPRMLRRHPVLAVQHLFDGYRIKPKRGS